MINLKKFDLTINRLLKDNIEKIKPIPEKFFKKKMKIDIEKIKEAILSSDKNEE